MKRKIQIWDHAESIMRALQKGVLLTTKSEEQVNTMTISWGMLGIEWRKPIFIVQIRTTTQHTMAKLLLVILLNNFK